MGQVKSMKLMETNLVGVHGGSFSLEPFQGRLEGMDGGGGGTWDTARSTCAYFCSVMLLVTEGWEGCGGEWGVGWV